MTLSCASLPNTHTNTHRLLSLGGVALALTGTLGTVSVVWSVSGHKEWLGS